MLRIPPDHRVDAAPARVAPLAFLAAGARRQSDGTLALCAGVGLVVAAVAVAFVPAWGPLALSALAVAAFGAWGIADRVAAERRAGSAEAARDGIDVALRIVRGALAVAGIAAFVGFAGTVLAILLGTIIS